LDVIDSQNGEDEAEKTQEWNNNENERYTNFATEDRKGNRKVVLDAAMLGPDLMCNITLVESSRLLNSLKRMLNYDCGRLASIFHNPVILMVFGHGCMKAAGMNFGSEYFTVQNMVEWSGGTKDICLITPNAFAGPDSGWIATPNLNWAMVPSSAMTGREESWDAGRRISRACEAAFLDEILASESFTPLIKINHSDGIGKRWDERKRLVDAVHAAFVGGGAGSAGGISFDFKTDRWEIDYKTRQGLPLILFQRRWDALRTSPPVGTVSSIVSVSKPTGNDKSFAVSPGDTVFDIGPNPVSASKIAEGDTLDNSFAVQETYRSMLLPIIHANSIFNDSSPIHENYLLSLLMYRINDDPRPSLAWLRQVASILSFRISVAELADRYATLVGFAWPGCRCANFPLQRWYKSLSKGQEEEFWRIFDKLSDKALFPGPQKMLQGDPTKKPIGYLAMVLMKKNVTEKKMDEFIGHMMSCEYSTD